MASESKHKPRSKGKPSHKAAMVNPRAQGKPAATVALNASVELGALGPQLAPAPPASQQRLPPVTEVRLFNTTRLLPAKYSESVLTRIAENDDDLQSIFALDNATNDRLLAEGNLRLGISARELVFDVPYCRIINAAFTHPHPLGARFSMPYRGAWYAGLELATAKAEVLFHRSVQFAEINWHQPEQMEYDQYTADFSGSFHDLRPSAFTHEQAGPLSQTEPQTRTQPLPNATHAGAEPCGGRQKVIPLQIQASEMEPTAAEFAACLAPDSYIDSQQLAVHLLEAGSLGIVYPSVRRPGGNCIACFRPSVIANVRKRDLYCLRWYPDRAAAFVRQPRVPPAETPA